MAPSDSQDLFDQLRELVAKSVEANNRLIQNGSDFLRQAADQKVDLSKLAADGNDVITEAMRDVVRLSAAHTSRLIDLGLEVSDRLAGRTSRRSTDAGQTSTSTLFDIRLTGLPGTTCQTAFAVDNDHTEAIPVAFRHGLLVDEAGKTATDVQIRFDPAEASIPGGGQGRFVLSLEIPAHMNPVLHHTLVSIEGLPRFGFRLLLQVEEPAIGTTKSTPRKPAPKKKAAVKAPTVKAGTTKRGASKATAKPKKTRTTGTKAGSKKTPAKATAASRKAAGKRRARKPASKKS